MTRELKLKIHIDLLDWNIFVYIGHKDCFKKRVRKYLTPIIGDRYDGYHITLGKNTFIRMERYDIGIISHEVNHCVQAILNEFHIPMNYNNTEVSSIMHEYILPKILKMNKQ